jgi:hypothetical protein
MSEYPKMVYLHDGSLAYRVVENRGEYEFYKAKGFVLERWDVKPKKEPLPMPATEAPPKPAPQKSYKRKPIKKFAIRRTFNAGKVEETKKNDGNSGASSGEIMEKEQGSGENGQERVA